MILKILLVIAIILQLFAVSLAAKMTKVTKFNSAWILFAVTLSLMTIQLVAEYINVLKGEILIQADVMVWIRVITALSCVIAVILTRQIIYYIAQIEEKKRITQKRILNTIISTEEKERRRFSKDLHDGLGPLLSSIKLSISALKESDNTDENKPILDNANVAIEEAIKSLKEISNNLSPHILTNFGFYRALTNFINLLSLPSNLKVRLNGNIGARRFSKHTETIVYRTVCELVNNAIKHANATLITIEINLADDKLNIVVADNGEGFDVEAYEQETKQGMGLYNISSRISSINGNFKIESIKGLGTNVKLEINEL
ncbi:MAG: histidine kinase [Rikenellaceae bacterium]